MNYDVTWTSRGGERAGSCGLFDTMGEAVRFLRTVAQRAPLSSLKVTDVVNQVTMIEVRGAADVAAFLADLHPVADEWALLEPIVLPRRRPRPFAPPSYN